MPHDFKEKPACATVNTGTPQEMPCPKCGDFVEYWSDEEEVKCSACGQYIELKKA